MYKIGDIVLILNGKEKVFVKIIIINLDNTFIVKSENGTKLRVYREDIID